MVDVLAFTSFEFSKNTAFSFKRKVPVLSIYQLRLSRFITINYPIIFS